MDEFKNIPPFSEVTKFHGHVCPGTAIGYRVGVIAFNKLETSRSTDEELLAVVENDSCSVDAIQIVTGCTMGKGNLIFKDYGKHVYTFFNRNSGNVLRISLNISVDEIDADFSKLRDNAYSESCSVEEKLEFEKRKNEISQKILDMPDKELFMIEFVDIDIPDEARVFSSFRCAKCGELVSEHRLRVENGSLICIPCFEDIHWNEVKNKLLT
jgi:formylmethanofuran dehydrogenase subunit E